MNYRNLLAVVFGVSLFASVTSALAADLAKGEKVFRKCKVCHSLKEGGKHKIGPNLFGIMGRESGTAKGFKYSKAMKEAGITWGVSTLTFYLTKPKDFIPGNKMAFPGLKKPEQIENIIAFLEANTK